MFSEVGGRRRGQFEPGHRGSALRAEAREELLAIDALAAPELREPEVDLRLQILDAPDGARSACLRGEYALPHDLACRLVLSGSEGPRSLEFILRSSAQNSRMVSVDTFRVFALCSPVSLVRSPCSHCVEKRNEGLSYSYRFAMNVRSMSVRPSRAISSSKSSSPSMSHREHPDPDR